jgi:hypothetical protein
MTTVTSPLAGRAIGLAAVPDPVFSGAMVGPGTAIDPVREPHAAVSPVDGIVVSLHPHAFVVRSERVVGQVGDFRIASPKESDASGARRRSMRWMQKCEGGRPSRPTGLRFRARGSLALAVVQLDQTASKARWSSARSQHAQIRLSSVTS